MTGLTPNVFIRGVDEPPPATHAVHAGPTSMLLEGADLRYVRVGDTEILRRLYVAVRDHNWNTLPLALSDLTIDQRADGFTVRFSARQAEGSIDFRWQGEIVGLADGTLIYTMDGVAHTAFRYNRIGLCVLHPPETSAGRLYTGQTPTGPIAGVLPDLIGAQRVIDGQIYALFPAVTQLTIQVADGATVDFAFEGDLFEMEDQRNWTDASFKTYSSPLAQPWPKDAVPGQQLRQRVTITPRGLTSAPIAAPAPVRLTAGSVSPQPLPSIGLGMASHTHALTPGEQTRLRAVQPAHLRVDVRPSAPDWSATLARARAAAEALGCRLELALFLDGDGQADLAQLAPALAGTSIVRVLVFHVASNGQGAESVSTGALVAMARTSLRSVVGDVPFVGGTDFNFTELNRRRPDPALIDAIAYSINAQVHASDDRSVLETVTAQADTVRSTLAIAGGRPVVVGPVTLKPRSNPNATGAATPTTDTLPDAVDPRQLSLLGAVWTAGSLAALATAGASSLTYFETTGWRGLMETETGSPAPDLFPSRPGMVFPLYHVFADLAEWRGGTAVPWTSSEPLAVCVLAVHAGDTLHLLVGNMAAADTPVVLDGLAGDQVRLRRLSSETVAGASHEPDAFRAAFETEAVAGGRLALTLAPYELVRIDGAADR